MDFEEGQKSGFPDWDSTPGELIDSILSDLDSIDFTIYNVVAKPQSTTLVNSVGKAKKSLEHLLDQSFNESLTPLPHKKASQPQLPNLTECSLATHSRKSPCSKKEFLL